MKIISRFNIGKKLQLKTIQNYIQILGGKTDNNISYPEDYRDTKQGKIGLPEYDWITEYMKRNNYSWLDLYLIDKTNYLSAEEFNKLYHKKIYKDDYKILSKKNNKLPNLNELDEIYENKFNEDFWKIDITNDF